MNKPEDTTKHLISISNYKKGEILGTITVHKCKDKYNSFKYQSVLRSNQNEDDMRISFTFTGCSRFVISLVMARDGSVFIIKHEYDHPITFDNLHAINTFLYTYGIYSLSINTLNRMSVDRPYYANKCSAQKGFSNPVEHKADYDSYIEFINRQSLNIINQSNDALNQFYLSNPHRIEVLGTCTKEYIYTHPYVYGKSYTEYEDPYPVEQIIQSVFHGSTSISDLAVATNDNHKFN